MRRINLLPPEERRRGLAIPRSGLFGILLVVGAAALVIMAGLYLFYLVRLNNEQQQIATLDQKISQQNQRLAELAPFKDLQARLDAKKPVADGIYRTRFAWAEFFQGLSFVIPPTTTLNSLTAQAAPIDIQASSGQILRPPGTITFTGVALPNYRNVADFIVQMNSLRYLSNTQLNSAELDRQGYTRPVINFEASSELITVVGQNGPAVPLESGPSANVRESPSHTLRELASSPVDRH